MRQRLPFRYPTQIRLRPCADQQPDVLPASAPSNSPASTRTPHAGAPHAGASQVSAPHARVPHASRNAPQRRGRHSEARTRTARPGIPTSPGQVASQTAKLVPTQRSSSIFRRRDVSIHTIAVSTFFLYSGYAVWRVLFNNFAKEELGINAFQVGVVQAVREVPGLLGFLVGVLAVLLAEVHIVTSSIILMGIGLILCGQAQTILTLGVGTVVMSVGFHQFLSSNQSLLLHTIKTKESARIQGRIRSVESAAAVAATLMLLWTTRLWDYRQIFFVGGIIIAGAGVCLSVVLRSNRAPGETRKVRLRRRYGVYYLLSFLRGCRRHIFTTFAIFLLVSEHGMHISVTTLLFLTASLITMFVFPLLGVVVERIGERLVLVGSSFMLVFIFLGYAYMPVFSLLIVCYVLDNILFGSNIALQSYIRKISSREDLTHCVSVGTTTNHISAVIIPIVGGFIWTQLGYRGTFVLGAVIVFIDMVTSFFVRVRAHTGLEAPPTIPAGIPAAPGEHEAT